MMKPLPSIALFFLAVTSIVSAQQAGPRPSSLGELTKQQAAKFEGVSPEEAKRLFEKAIGALAPGDDVAAAGLISGAIAANPKKMLEVVETSVRVQPLLAPVTVATVVGSHPEQAAKVVAAARSGVRLSVFGQTETPKAEAGTKVVAGETAKTKATVATLNAAIVAASRAAGRNGEVSGWLWGIAGRPIAVVRPIDALNQAAAGLPVLYPVEEEGGGTPIDPGTGGEGGGTPVDPGDGGEGGGGSVSNNTP